MHDEKDINIFNKDRVRLHPCIALTACVTPILALVPKNFIYKPR